MGEGKGPARGGWRGRLVVQGIGILHHRLPQFELQVFGRQRDESAQTLGVCGKQRFGGVILIDEIIGGMRSASMPGSP